MKKLSLILLTAAALCASSAIAQTTQKFTAAKHNEYGLTYSLPVTHLRVTLTAQCTVKKAGPFYKYAKKYLGLDQVITDDSKQWDLTDVDIASYGVPDNSEQYLMQFKSGSMVYVMKSDDGLLLSINTENVTAPEKQRRGTKLSESVLDDNKYATALPGELLMSESTAKRAEIAAQLIYKIRESRTNFATGEADQMPPDGEALKEIMRQLDAQEATLMALFAGTTQTMTAVKTLDYLPSDSVDVNDVVIARISDFNGITSADDLSGEPVYLSMKVLDKPSLPVDEKGVTKKLPKGAVMYRMPGKARFSVKYNRQQMKASTFDIAQLGVNFGLDPDLFSNKKQPSYVKFHPTTGSVAEIGAVSM